MEASILVEIPEKCFISANPSKGYPCAFSFRVTYGYIPVKSLTESNELGNHVVNAIPSPQITISGFEKLLTTEKIGEFIGELKKTGGKQWTIGKEPTSNIIIKYTGTKKLEPDFFFMASTEGFVFDIKNNELVTLAVTTKDFDGVKAQNYIINTKVDYMPWAKSISFEKPAGTQISVVPLGSKVNAAYDYMGDNVDKILSQNGLSVSTGKSPYEATINSPSLFTLKVFNQSGGDDSCQKSIDVDPPKIVSFEADRYYFAEGEEVTLTWSVTSVSNITIDGFDEKRGDTINGNSATVHPKTNPGETTTTYTLIASGFKNKNPTSTTAKVVLTETYWKESGSIVAGYFWGDVYGNINYNSRIFIYEDCYYCYAHPKLYKSADGLNWVEYAANNAAKDSFVCIATGFYDGMLYAMGREGTGDALFISTHNVGENTWTYGAAHQVGNNSNIGSFALSVNSKAYAQTLSSGIMITRCSDDGRWNIGTSIIRSYKGSTIISGDYCFFKDKNYAVMLSSDCYIYVYDCRDEMQELSFKKKVVNDSNFVSFVRTTNRLYIITNKSIIDLEAKDIADYFHPPLNDYTKRPWLSDSNCDKCFGVFPDKKLWTFNKD